MANTISTSSLDLSQLKPLTTEQYDKCREAALRRVQARIGDKPLRRDFERELGALWTFLDILALVVFAAAFAISSVHIIVHMGVLASDSYANLTQSTFGTSIGADLYTAIHQWGAIAMSEGSMILFAVLFGLTRKTWRRWIFAALALIAAIFVIVANWQSGVGALESVMPAIFTLGLGLNLERLIVQTLKRREEVTTQYLAALATWEASNQDATTHIEYAPLLRQEIWQKLVSLAANKAFADAPPSFKAAATRREMERDSWVFDSATTGNAPIAAPVAYPNGTKGVSNVDDPLVPSNVN